jgi:prepilin-type N-terminal cleavage/methylation domain-containing protein
MNKTGTIAGFTLVELMVVMAIVATLFSLIGPFTHNQIEKVKASEEWYDFTQFTKTIGTEAFFAGRPIVVKLEGTSAKFYQGSAVKEITYQQIVFPEQVIRFNANGYAEQARVKAYVRNQEKVFILNNKNELVLRDM